MDDEKEIMTAEGAENDSFMDGWEETTSETGEELEENGPQGAAGPTEAEEETQEPEAAGEDQPRPKGTGLGRPGGEMPGQTGGEAPEESEDGGGQDGGDQAAQEPPRTWELNHLGQRITANEADLVTLAQKGLDYDRIRSEYDEAKPVMAMFREFAGKAGMELGPYLAHIRAQAKQAEGMSQEEARRAVELEDREAAVAQQEAVRQQAQEAARQELARRQTAQARMQADLQEFREVFPEAAADPGSIPREVWAEVRAGRSLVGAYARFQGTQQRAAMEQEAQRAAAQRQNEQNAARSAGSMRSAGAETASKDPFLAGWMEE